VASLFAGLLERRRTPNVEWWQVGGIASKDLDGGINEGWNELLIVDFHGLGRWSQIFGAAIRQRPKILPFARFLAPKEFLFKQMRPPI
jgi:hypothetical protein